MRRIDLTDDEMEVLRAIVDFHTEEDMSDWGQDVEAFRSLAKKTEPHVFIRKEEPHA